MCTMQHHKLYAEWGGVVVELPSLNGAGGQAKQPASNRSSEQQAVAITPRRETHIECHLNVTVRVRLGASFC